MHFLGHFWSVFAHFFCIELCKWCVGTRIPSLKRLKKDLSEIQCTQCVIMTRFGMSNFEFAGFHLIYVHISVHKHVIQELLHCTDVLQKESQEFIGKLWRYSEFMVAG